MKEDIKSLTYPALCQRFGDLGLKRFRADQVYAWLHKVGVQDFEEMTNLPKALRDQLARIFGANWTKGLPFPPAESRKNMFLPWTIR